MGEWVSGRRQAADGRFGVWGARGGSVASVRTVLRAVMIVGSIITP